MGNTDDSPQSSPINMLCCDRCGCTVSIPLIEIMNEIPVEEMRDLIQERFFAVKRAFGKRGWSTSVGYDLCPLCCKSTGTMPGYGENGLLPETTFIPRAERSE